MAPLVCPRPFCSQRGGLQGQAAQRMLLLLAEQGEGHHSDVGSSLAVPAATHLVSSVPIADALKGLLFWLHIPGTSPVYENGEAGGGRVWV